MKFKEGQQFKLFASNITDAHASKFQSTDQLFYLYQLKKTQFSFLSSGDQFYFDFLSITNNKKKESEN